METTPPKRRRRIWGVKPPSPADIPDDTAHPCMLERYSHTAYQLFTPPR